MSDGRGMSLQDIRTGIWKLLRPADLFIYIVFFVSGLFAGLINFGVIAMVLRLQLAELIKRVVESSLPKHRTLIAQTYIIIIVNPLHLMHFI